MFNSLKKVPKEILQDIQSTLANLDQKLLFMHFCGTHQHTIVKYGIDDFLARYGIEVREGPGCPVCVTTTKEIEMGLKLAREGITITTFGDLMKVPGHTGSLSSVEGKVKVVYSIEDSIEYAKDHKNEDVVFLAVGFETTMPSTASQILLEEMPENHYVLTFHKFTPPALDAVLSLGEVKLDGIILPGHVSTIIGVRPWRKYATKYKIPMVIAGFEPIDVLVAIKVLVSLVTEKSYEVVNEYVRSVQEEGNTLAQKFIKEAFDVVDGEWRGFGKIRKSMAEIKAKFDNYNAKKVFEDLLEDILEKDYPEPPGCKCGDIIRGAAVPTDCPLFAKVCTPDNPIGPCMVSSEGACGIVYKYKKKHLK